MNSLTTVNSVGDEISALVPVATGDIGANTVQTVNARDLHVWLGVGKDFSNWIKGRISQYGFTQDLDFAVLAKTGDQGIQGKIEYHISLDMAKELSMVERNAKGKEARQYFIACEKASKNTLPDFSNPAAAARAWADEYDKRLLLEKQAAEDKPYTELARIITGQSTMTRRDWCALMKEDHDTEITERKLTKWLFDGGYCYRDQLSGQTRAYAKFSHLFKLEVEQINGFPRYLLKVTGQGVFELTPKIVAEFRDVKV